MVPGYSAVDAYEIIESASLAVLDVDSLPSIELMSTVKKAYGIEVDLNLYTTVSRLLSTLGQTPERITVIQPRSPPLSAGKLGWSNKLPKF